jgi:hypothetical protein
MWNLCFEANQSEYRFLLHILMNQYIRIHPLFASFAQICIQIFDLMQTKYMLKRIFASEQIFALIFSDTGIHLIQNINFEANIR